MIQQAFELALQHHQAGRLAEAEGLYRRILNTEPNHVEALNNLGIALAGLGRLDESIDVFRRATEIAPAYVTARFNLGNTLRDRGQIDEAIVAYRALLRINPNHAQGWNNLGAGIMKTQGGKAAFDCFRTALAISPQYVDALANLSGACVEMERWEDAIAFGERALALKPSLAVAHLNLSVALCGLECWEKAIGAARKASAIDPRSAVAHNNLAVGLVNTGNFEEADFHFRQALCLRPDYADAHTGWGLLRLLRGHFRDGWREYEWRPGPKFAAAPRWDGSSADDKTILVRWEQGYGDTLQFVRYLPSIHNRYPKVRVILGCQPALARLLAGAVDNFGEVVALEESDPCPIAADWHISMLSLPNALELFEPLEIVEPYIHVDAALFSRWRERLRSNAILRVGIAWAGNIKHLRNRSRSIEFESLATIFQVEKVEFYSLQIEPRAETGASLPCGIVDLGPEIKDFSDTAAVMTELDLIISVDTAVAHLAGALGRPVWTLLPFVPDWRWGLEGDTTPWYPTMRLFRQPKLGDWDSVIQRVAEELKLLVKSRNP